MNNYQSSQLLKRTWHTYVKRHWPKLLLAMLFMILEGGAMYVFVQALRPMIDEVFNSGNSDMIWPVTAVVCGVFVARGIGSFIHRSLTINTGINVVAHMQRDLTAHLLKQDMKFFNSHSPGELIERVRGDTQGLQNLASTTLLTIGRDLTTLIAMLTAALQIDVMWTLVLFVGAPLLVLPIALLQRIIRKQSRFSRVASAELSNRLDEIFHGIKAIKLNNLRQHEGQRFDNGVQEFVQTSLRSQYSSAAMPAMIDIVAGIGFVAVIYYGGMEIVTGEKTTGAFMTFFAAIALMFDPIRRLTNISGALQGALANLERIYYLFDMQPVARKSAQAKRLDNPRGDIEFRDVNFSYGDQPVLQNLSFIAPGGKTTAFVGPSGAGKSTLFNVLTQLELPEQGQVLIGGENIAEIELNALRQDIAVVSQESALFDESIRSNILMGNLEQSDDAVNQVAQTALVNEFALAQPEGLDTLAGPRGSNLSGGQRQRVIIARALLRDAPILLLDEATSALDNETERKIQALLDEFTQGRTTLVIAHRLTTVMNADLIHVMHEGRIVESGTHDELLARNGHYSALHSTLEK